MNRYFDSHCHLQDERFGDSIAELIARAKTAGVAGFLCCGSSEKDWPEVVKRAEAEASVVCAFGLHPWYAGGRSEQWLDKLDELLTRYPASCVGEIGLDRALDESTFAQQESVFVTQLELAERRARPVSIHCRRAFGRMLELLRQRGGGVRGVVHSYSGPPDLVRAFEDLGLSISFSGSLTFPNGKRARASAAVVTAGRLLIETDSPDIRPNGWATELNEPANVVRVAETLAEIRGVSVSEIAALTWENARRVFGTSPGFQPPPR